MCDLTSWIFSFLNSPHELHRVLSEWTQGISIRENFGPKQFY